MKKAIIIPKTMPDLKGKRLLPPMEDYTKVKKNYEITKKSGNQRGVNQQSQPRIYSNIKGKDRVLVRTLKR